MTCIAISKAEPVIRENKERWVCYDHSVNYEKLNPEWDCVTISQNQYFRGISHMVNYKLDRDNLTIHDEFNNINYTIPNYKTSGYYFHFWRNDTPVRNYKIMRCN